MGTPNLPWNCPNPYCKDPHNPSSTPVNGVIKCHSCGWERRVAQAQPEAVDDLPGLFSSIPEEPKKEVPKDKTPPLSTIAAHKEWIFGISFTTDGKYLLTVSRDKTVKIWDLAAAKETQVLKGQSPFLKRKVKTLSTRIHRPWNTGFRFSRQAR